MKIFIYIFLIFFKVQWDQKNQDVMFLVVPSEETYGKDHFQNVGPDLDERPVHS
jgi:hypothetical protein